MSRATLVHRLNEQVGWHHSDIIGTILKVVALAHLQSGNLGDGIFLLISDIIKDEKS